jgi:hypothetical protein
VHYQSGRLVMAACQYKRGVGPLDKRSIELVLRTVKGYIQPRDAHDVQIAIEAFRAHDAANGNVAVA